MWGWVKYCDAMYGMPSNVVRGDVSRLPYLRNEVAKGYVMYRRALRSVVRSCDAV